MDKDIQELQDALESAPENNQALGDIEARIIGAGHIEQLMETYDSVAARIDDEGAADNLWKGLASRLEEAADSGNGTEANAQCLYAAGEVHALRLGRRDKAMLCFQRSFKVHPSMTKALDAARDIYREQESFQMVARLFELELQVTTEAVPRADLLYQLGRVLADDLAKPDDAAEAFSEALELRPDAEEIKEALHYVTSVQESWTEVVARYEEEAAAATDDSLAASLYLRTAEILQKEDPKSDRIEDLLRSCLEREPKNPTAFALLGKLSGDNSDPSARKAVVEKRLDAAETKEERLESLTELARIAAADGDEETASGHYREALAVDHGCTEAIRFLCGALGADGDWEAVIEMHERALKALRRGPEEIRLLVDLATIHWKELADLDTAEKHFRRIKLNDPRNRDMLGFYQDFQRAKEDWRKLLSTLSTVQQLEGDKGRKVAIGYEMAEIAEERLENLDKAVDVWKGISRIAPDDLTARMALKRLFQKTKKWNALLEFLKQEIAALEDGSVEAKVAIYLEMIAIYRDELHLDVMVINTFNTLLQVDPANAAALDALAEKYEGASRWNDLIGVLQRKADGEDEPKQLVALLHRIAGLWLDKFSNQGKAVVPLERILEATPDDAEAIEQLKGLYSARRDWRSLVAVQEKELELLDPAARRPLLEEMARLAEKRLKLPEKAITLWERRVSEADDGKAPEEAIDALESLYTKTERWADLADLLERRMDLISDGAARLETLRRQAELLDTRLDRPDEAITRLQEALAIDPARDDVRDTLTDLYRRQGEWDDLESLFLGRDDSQGLLAVLDRAAPELTDPSECIRMHSRIAELAGEVGDEKRVVAAREALLDLQPSNAELARELVPVYRGQARWTELIRMHEVILDAEQDAASRLDLMRAVWSTYEEELGDAAAAFRWCGRAFQESTDDAVAAELERLADATDNWEELVILARDVVDDVKDPDRQVRFYLRMGAICMNRLAWIEDATTYYEKALAGDADSAEAIEALERLYARAEAWDKLVDTLRLKVEMSSNDANRVLVLFQVCEILEDVVDRPDEAAGAYSSILDVDPGNIDALGGLERLHERSEDWEAVAGVVEQQLELAATDEARVDRLYRLAVVCEEHLSDRARAVELHRELLEARPAHDPTVERLEALLAEGSEDVACARLLEPIYRRREEWSDLARVVEVALEGADDVGSRVDGLKQVADLAHRRLGDPRRAFNALRRAFDLVPDDRALWDEMESLAGDFDAWDDLVTSFGEAIEGSGLLGEDHVALALRVAALHEDRRDDPAEAAKAHERVLELDPDNRGAVEALERLYTRIEVWPALVATLERKTIIAVDDDERLRIYLKICNLQEEVMDELDNAAESYRQVLSLDPRNMTALQALERLHRGAERHVELADILRAQIEAVEAAEPDEPDVDEDDIAIDLADEAGTEAVEARFRLGRVLEQNLADAQQAVEMYGEVLERGAHREAVRALDGLLESPPDDTVDVEAFRRRVTEILEPAYRDVEDWPALVHLLEVRLTLSDDPFERVELLLSVAGLLEREQDDPEGASRALSRALCERPGDESVRKEAERVAELRGSFAELLEDLTKAREQADESEVRVTLLRRSGEIAEQQLSDAAAAEDLYRALLEENPDDRAGMDALEGVLRRQGKHGDVVAVLEMKVEATADGEQIGALLHQIGEIHDSILDDPAAAIDAFRRVLEMLPADTAAMDAMVRLLTVTERWAELIPVHQMQAETEEDLATRKATLGRIAAVHDEHLGEASEAIAVWSSVLDLDPDDRTATRELARIYEREERWGDLLDILSRQVEVAGDAAERAELRLRMGHLLKDRLDDTDRAIEAYREVLEAAPGDAGAREALEGLLADEGHRRRAAEVLEPFYTQAADWAALVRTLEIRLDDSVDPELRAGLLARIAQLQETKLESPAGAYDALARSLSQNRGDGAVLDGLERLAGDLGRWEDLVELLAEAAEDEMDGDVVLALRLKIADIHYSRLDSLEGARDGFRRALQLDPANRVALNALERIFTSTESWDELLSVHRTKADSADEQEERVSILFKMATLYHDLLDDRDGAIATYREILDIEEDQAEAIAGLSRLFEAGELWRDLEELLARQISFAADATTTAGLMHRIGTVRAAHLDDTSGALDIWTDLLRDQPDHEPTVEELESLFAEGTERARVAALLEPVYRARSAWAELVGVLGARREATDDPIARVEIDREVAKIQESTLFDDVAAYHTLLGAFRETPDDPTLRVDLERLAEDSGGWEEMAATFEESLPGIDDPETRLDVLRALARTADEQLHDYAKARDHWRAVLDQEADDTAAADALERLHTRAEQWDELVELYNHKAERTLDAQEKVQIHFKVCNLFEEVLDRPESAVETYRSILDVEPDNRAALGGLERLFHQLQQWEELTELLAVQIGTAEDPARATTIRHRLAEILDERLDRRSDAIDLLREALEADSSHGPSLSTLEHMLRSYGDEPVEDAEPRRQVCAILRPIYEAAGEWAKLVEVQEAEVQDSRDEHDQIELLRSISNVQELHLADIQGAFRSLARAFRIRYGDPEIRPELERLADQLGWWDRVVNTYLEGIEDLDDPGLASEMLGRLGEIFEQKLDHAGNAIEIYQRLLLLEEDHTGALDSLERLYRRTGHHEDLVDVLHRKARLVDDALERKELLFRICEIWEDVVGDRGKAIETYVAVREIDREDLAAVEALERLFRVTGDWISLVELCREKAEMSPGDEQRIRCWFEVATLSDEQLSDVDAAVDAYRTVLDINSANRTALSALEALYEREERWTDLLDALEMGFAVAEEDPTRDRLQMRTGTLLADHLDDGPRAVETFRLLLERNPDHADAVVALEGLLGNEDHRGAAAEVLEPVHERQESWEKLVGVLAIRVEGAFDADAKVGILRRMASIQRDSLERRHDAMSSLGDAVRLRPAEADLTDGLEDLARAVGDIDAVVTLYAEVRADAGDTEVERELALRMARILDLELGRPAAAVDAYEQVLEADPSHADALEALDRLCAELERWEDLGKVLERRVDLAAGGPDSATLRHRLGALRDGVFSDPPGAIECYREVLFEAPDHAEAREALERIGEDLDYRETVVEILETIYTETEDWALLVALLDRKAELLDDPTDLADLLRRTAQLAEARLDDRTDAFDRFARALEASPSDTLALTELERLAPELERWSGLALALDKAAELADDPDTSRLLSLKSGTLFLEHLEDPGNAEVRFKSVLESMPEDAEALVALEGIYRRTGNDGALVEVALKRAETLFDAEDRKAAYREVARVATERLGDDELAARALRQILELDEGDREALDGLETLYVDSGDSAALADVLDMRIQRTVDGEELLALHRRLGSIHASLGEVDRACEHYRTVLDMDPTNEHVLGTLQDLYEQSSRWDDLQEILTHRISMAESPGDRSPLVKRLARLLEEELDDPSAAVEHLRQVQEDDPEDREALEGTMRLYGRLEQWYDLVEILRARAEATTDDAERLAMLVRISDVAQEHLDDPDLTKSSLEQVLESDPDNLDALSVLFRTYEREANWDECFKILDRQAELVADDDNVRRAAVLHRRGELLADHLDLGEQASNAFLAALDADPARIDTMDRLQSLYEAAEEWRGVVEILRHRVEAVDQVTAKAEFHKEVATLLRDRLDDPAGAVTALKAARDLTPDDPDVTRPLIDAFVAAKQWDEARPLLDSLIASLRESRQMRDLHVYLHLRGVVSLDTGDADAARSDFEATHELDATYLPNLLSLGKFHFDRQDWEAALKIFQTMLLHQADMKGKAQKADIFWHLGTVRAHLGDARRARDMFNRALMLISDHGPSKASLENL